jgi:ADP-ribose pyrophosphatase YjhB (NUDIX family)
MKKEKRVSLIAAAHMVLEKNGKIFLMQRANTGYQDGCFGLPAGHVDHGETFLDCAIREAKEEAGVKIKAKDVEYLHTIHKYSDTLLENRVEIFFTTKKWQGEPKIREPHKCSSAGWYSKNKLPKNMVDYVGESLKLIFKKDKKNRNFHEKKV